MLYCCFFLIYNCLRILLNSIRDVLIHIQSLCYGKAWISIFPVYDLCCIIQINGFLLNQCILSYSDQSAIVNEGYI